MLIYIIPLLGETMTDDDVPSLIDIEKSKTKVDESEKRVEKHMTDLQKIFTEFQENKPIPLAEGYIMVGVAISKATISMDEITNYRDVLKGYIKLLEIRLKEYDPDQML